MNNSSRFTEDVQERVRDGTDSRTGQVGDGELPPAGQLRGHDVAGAHPEPVETDREPVDGLPSSR
jgi:hypothetical protein